MVSRGALTYLEETRPQQKDLSRLNVSGMPYYSLFSVFSVIFLIESIVDVSMVSADLGTTIDVCEC